MTGICPLGNRHWDSLTLSSTPQRSRASTTSCLERTQVAILLVSLVDSSEIGIWDNHYCRIHRWNRLGSSDWSRDPRLRQTPKASRIIVTLSTLFGKECFPKIGACLEEDFVQLIALDHKGIEILATLQSIGQDECGLVFLRNFPPTKPIRQGIRSNCKVP
jgi:hypothetical protein